MSSSCLSQVESDHLLGGWEAELIWQSSHFPRQIIKKEIIWTRRHPGGNSIHIFCWFWIGAQNAAKKEDPLTLMLILFWLHHYFTQIKQLGKWVYLYKVYYVCENQRKLIFLVYFSFFSTEQAIQIHFQNNHWDAIHIYVDWSGFQRNVTTIFF